LIIDVNPDSISLLKSCFVFRCRNFARDFSVLSTGQCSILIIGVSSFPGSLKDLTHRIIKVLFTKVAMLLRNGLSIFCLNARNVAIAICLRILDIVQLADVKKE